MQQLPKINKESLNLLKDGKNLLAFSAGVDSSALFHALLANKIKFKVAHVNYHTRKESEDETEHTLKLCKEWGIECFVHRCKLDESNFENSARVERYDFFKKILKEQKLENLLTAHHLNDRFEWLLMRLTRGSGAVSLAGFKEIEKWGEWKIIRPFFEISKEKLHLFLEANGLKYFEDSSNFESKYFRNYIRHNFSNPLMKDFEDGIAKSLKYLMEDGALLQGVEPKKIEDLWIFDRSKAPSPMVNIDKIMKSFGLVLSKSQRDEIFEKDGVVGGKIAIGWHERYVAIAPYVKTKMSKEFKEICRTHKVPPLIRPYLFKKEVDPTTLTHMF